MWRLCRLIGSQRRDLSNNALFFDRNPDAVDVAEGVEPHYVADRDGLPDVDVGFGGEENLALIV